MLDQYKIVLAFFSSPEHSLYFLVDFVRRDVVIELSKPLEIDTLFVFFLLYVTYLTALNI